MLLIAVLVILYMHDIILLLVPVIRDINERGRELDKILDQYTNLVKPAFEEFTLPVYKPTSIHAVHDCMSLCHSPIHIYRLRSMLTLSFQEAQRTKVISLPLPCNLYMHAIIPHMYKRGSIIIACYCCLCCG